MPAAKKQDYRASSAWCDAVYAQLDESAPGLKREVYDLLMRWQDRAAQSELANDNDVDDEHCRGGCPACLGVNGTVF